MMKKAVVIICLTLAATVLICGFPLMYFYYSGILKNVADFSACEDEFEAVKDYVYNSEYASGDILGIDYNLELQRYRVFSIKRNTYDNISDELSDIIRKIKNDAFKSKDAHWNTIRIYDDCIVFVIDTGEYALVYSPGGTPSADLLPLRANENKSVRVKKAKGSWYHLIKVNRFLPLL